MSGWFSKSAGAEEESAVTPSTTSSKRGPPCCCNRVAAELKPCQPWFLIADVTGRKLDIPESFAPASCRTFVIKLVLTGLSWFTLFWAIYKRDKPRAFFFAYFTNYGVIWAALYHTLSLFNTVFAGRTPQPPERAGMRIRMTWIFFEMAGNWSAIAAILFWLMVYDPESNDMSYNTLVPHGITTLFVFIDGFYLNRIPCRWMHWCGVILPAQASWIIWSAIHAYVFTSIGNPTTFDNDPDTNDDAIYDVLDWKGDTSFVVVFAGACLLVISPLIFSIQWMISLYGMPVCCGKDIRYYVDRVYDANDSRPSINDVEEGSIFQQYG